MHQQTYKTIALTREEWSRIIQRLASAGVWPEGNEGVKLALELVGVSEELDRRNNDSASSS